MLLGPQDLIRKIFVVNPSRRATIATIQQHPWFQRGLPPGALDYNVWAMQVRRQRKTCTRLDWLQVTACPMLRAPAFGHGVNDTMLLSGH